MLDVHDVKRIGRSAAWISSGVSLVIVEFIFSLKNENGAVVWQIDIFHDGLGVLLILIGVLGLNKFFRKSPYSLTMKLLSIAAGLALSQEILAQFLPRLSQQISALANLLGLLYIVAVIRFCHAMKWFCREHNLLQSEKSWDLTTQLIRNFYVIPFVLMRLLGIAALLSPAGSFTKLSEIVRTTLNPGFLLFQLVTFGQKNLLLSTFFLVIIALLLLPWGFLTNSLIGIKKELGAKQQQTATAQEGIPR